MSDSPSLRDVVEEAAESIEPKVEETTEAPKEEPKVEETEEQPKEETQEESFAEKGELKGKTPEELEEIYKNWNKAYTTKRQKETQELKEYKAKLAELEQKVNQPQQSGNIEQRASDAQQALQLGQMTVAQYTEYMQNLAAEQAREVAREEYQSMVAQEREQQLADKAVDDFKEADPRLNDLSPEFNESLRNEVQRELAELLDDHLEKNGSYKGFDAKALTKQIVERRDKELDEIIKKRTIQSTQAAKMREAKAKKSEMRGTSSQGQPVGGNSIRDILSEAVDMA